jgi:hypothetical protein
MESVKIEQLPAPEQERIRQWLQLPHFFDDSFHIRGCHSFHTSPSLPHFARHTLLVQNVVEEVLCILLL